VLKGPGTALYGSDRRSWRGERPHSARPADAEPRSERGRRCVRLTGGCSSSGGATSGNNGVRADVNLTRSENWKQEAPFRRQSGTVRWDFASPGGWTAHTVLTGSHVDQQDVPALSVALFDTSRS